MTRLIELITGHCAGPRPCPCPHCEAMRFMRLMQDLDLAYGCNTPAEYEAKRKAAVN